MYDTSLQITTPRLILRQPRVGELDDWAAFMAEEETTRHIGGVQPRFAVWRSMMSMIGAWQVQGFAMFSVIERASGAWLGRLGPWQPEGWPGTEVGWGLRAAAQGRGYATEGAIAAIDWAFDALGWTEVIHAVAPTNQASQRVAQRLGSENRGPGRLPVPFDQLPIDIWGQTRAQWQAHRARLPLAATAREGA